MHSAGCCAIKVDVESREPSSREHAHPPRPRHRGPHAAARPVPLPGRHRALQSARRRALLLLRLGHVPLPVGRPGEPRARIRPPRDLHHAPGCAHPNGAGRGNGDGPELEPARYHAPHGLRARRARPAGLPSRGPGLRHVPPPADPRGPVHEHGLPRPPVHRHPGRGIPWPVPRLRGGALLPLRRTPPGVPGGVPQRGEGGNVALRPGGHALLCHPLALLLRGRAPPELRAVWEYAPSAPIRAPQHPL